MTIYIEYALFSNAVFDFILLRSLGAIMKISFSKTRLWLAVLSGALTAVAVPLFNLGVVLSVAVKLALSAAIVAIFARYGGKKRFAAALMLFWGLTFAMGGVLFGLYFMTGASFAVNADLSLSSDSALPLFAAGILCFAFLTKKLAAYICGRRMSASFVYDVTMTLGGKRYSVKGYLDSGNRLTSDGLPVIIATSGRMRNAVARQAAEDLLDGRARYAEYSTLAGGTRKMPVVECGDITVGGRRLNALVGAAGKTTAAFGCEVLLGAWMDTDGGEK